MTSINTRYLCWLLGILKSAYWFLPCFSHFLWGNWTGYVDPFLMSLVLGCVALLEFIAAPHEGAAWPGSGSRSSCPGTQQTLRSGCQKDVKGVVAGTRWWCIPFSGFTPHPCQQFASAAHNRKKLETIESNSFARNHRRVKLRDNIVSCPGRNVLARPDPDPESRVLCPESSSCSATRGNVFRIWNWIASRLSKKSTTQRHPLTTT